jgi:hypothetical protein
MDDKNYQKVSYFATIPAPVRYSNLISNFSKLLYAEITCLTNAKGYCFAMNGYLADLFKVHKNTISGSIKELETAGFIKCEYITKNKEVIERRIYLLLDTQNQNGYEIELNGYEIKTRENIGLIPINETSETPNKKDIEVSQKTVRPPTKKSVENVFSNVSENVFSNLKNEQKKQIVLKSEIEFLKSKQLELLGEYKDDIIDLYEYKFFNDLVIDNNDSKYKIDAMLKTDEFALIEKKCRKLKSEIIKPETINRKNLINYFNDIGKIQVSDNIFLYPYEIIKLRMVYNPKFLTKKVREFDNFCFEDKNFKRYIDHYSTIKNWLETEIEKVKKNPKYEKSEIYHYYNWGVSRNEI